MASERRSGPLVAIAEQAAADPTRKYVLVIDEIDGDQPA